MGQVNFLDGRGKLEWCAKSPVYYKLLDENMNKRSAWECEEKTLETVKREK